MMSNQSCAVGRMGMELLEIVIAHFVWRSILA